MNIKISDLKSSETRELLLEAQKVGVTILKEANKDLTMMSFENITITGLGKIIADLREEVRQLKEKAK